MTVNINNHDGDIAISQYYYLVDTELNIFSKLIYAHAKFNGVCIY